MLGKAFIEHILKGIQLGAIVCYINLDLDASWSINQLGYFPFPLSLFTCFVTSLMTCS